MREYGFVMQQISFGIQAYDLAACSETGVYRKSALLPHRCGEKELAEVVSEYAYGLDIGLLLCLTYDFAADGRLQQSPEGILNGHLNLLCSGFGRVTVLLTEFVINFLAALFLITVQPYGQHPFITGAEYGQKTVRSDMGKRFGIIGIAAIFVSLVCGGVAGFAGDYPACAENLPHSLPDGRSLGNAFCNYVTGTGKGSFGVCKF